MLPLQWRTVLLVLFVISLRMPRGVALSLATTTASTLFWTLLARLAAVLKCLLLRPIFWTRKERASLKPLGTSSRRYSGRVRRTRDTTLRNPPPKTVFPTQVFLRTGMFPLTFDGSTGAMPLVSGVRAVCCVSCCCQMSNAPRKSMPTHML